MNYSTEHYVTATCHKNSPILRLATQILSRQGKTVTAVFSKDTARAARISTENVN